MSFRATRSGRVFSPWVNSEPSNVSPVYTDADFPQLLAQAIDEEGVCDEEDDDTELVPEVEGDGDGAMEDLLAAGCETPQPGGSTKNSHRHRKRAMKRREEAATLGYQLDAKLRASLLKRAEAVSVDYEAAEMPAAQNAYTAKRASIANRARSYTPRELDDMGFRRVAYQPG